MTYTRTGHEVKHGRKTHQKGVTTSNRREAVAELRAQLAKFKAEQHPEFIADVTARFDGYSPDNALIIAMQRPEATDVDSRAAWIERGRLPVGKDTAMKIIRPGNIRKVEDPANPGKEIELVDFWVWNGLFDVATTIEVDPAHLAEMLKNRKYTPPEVLAWRKTHPQGTW